MYDHDMPSPETEGMEIAAWEATSGDGTFFSTAPITASTGYAITFDRNDDGSETVTITNPDGSTVTSAPGATTIKDGNLTIALSADATGSAINTLFTIVDNVADHRPSTRRSRTVRMSLR
jgi:hypothetical protein